MFSHIVLGCDDISVARSFYDALFAVSGCDETGIDGKGRLFYSKNNQRLVITKPINGQAASAANGGTVGLLMPSEAAVYRWYQVGVEQGGQGIEDAPGIREFNGTKKCLAYLRDPTGNKLCAYYPVD